MPATYRSITKSEIGIAVAMMREFYAIDGYPMDLERSKALFETFIGNENLGKCWFICDGEEIIGYIILTFVFSFEYGGTIAFLDELYISVHARGKGFGKSSVEFIKIQAHQLSLKLLYLEVENHNANAQKLYLSAGFSQHNRKLMLYKIK